MKTLSDEAPSCYPARMVLETTARSRSTRFYQALMGWEIESVDVDEGRATLCRGDDREIARICDGPVDRWVTIFSKEDLVGTLARAREDDARLTAMPAWGGGALEVEHPTGTKFGIEDSSGSVAWRPTVGSLSLAELLIWETPAAIAFCADVLGLESRPLPEDPTEFHVLFADRHAVAGLWNMRTLYPSGTEPHWLPYVGIKDCDLATVTAVELGARVRVPPSDTVLGRFSVIEDPLGATFGLIRPISPETYEDALRVTETVT
jgi:uncharacterized protein